MLKNQCFLIQSLKVSINNFKTSASEHIKLNSHYTAILYELTEVRTVIDLNVFVKTLVLCGREQVS